MPKCIVDHLENYYKEVYEAMSSVAFINSVLYFVNFSHMNKYVALKLNYGHTVLVRAALG